MTKYSNPEFKVVITPAQDILTASSDSTNPINEGPDIIGDQVPLGF